MVVAARLISTSNLPVHLDKSQSTIHSKQIVEALNKAGKLNVPEQEFRHGGVKVIDFSGTLISKHKKVKENAMLETQKGEECTSRWSWNAVSQAVAESVHQNNKYWSKNLTCKTQELIELVNNQPLSSPTLVILLIYPIYTRLLIHININIYYVIYQDSQTFCSI